jgi:hypothetical protein
LIRFPPEWFSVQGLA